ncbi:protein adenylyltransferase SelO family protein [Corynebacterium breve]|uniref:Protein nucleotidyltransferase YdiU n=1 Tax=Corynebacterium breve TaxID=3049799 RepID=A0ABY8VF46_9CORY|nr:protein adenylyltransferase SelO family protein [Corynebacterium breve]WIM66859.1 protein adenylyltransferase SelO family protein [Corynebacterium breve]
MNAPRLTHNFAAALPELCVPTQAAQFPSPDLVVLNEGFARELGLDPNWLRSEEGIAWLAGSAGGVATAYAGHQFGGFSPLLGDGRAMLLGELGGYEIQLKGSGRTRFSRPGSDGRGALGPMLREYLVSEFMHAVGVPTTRALAVVTTGERIVRNGRPAIGALLVRAARSHLRVGTVQYAATQSLELTQKVVEYAGFSSPSELLDTVIDRQLPLVLHWMRLGFIHGVMNTDNTTLSGETIDYGPCAFTEAWDNDACFSSIDTSGRYAFGQQLNILGWNLTRLAEALLPIADEAQLRSLLDELPGRLQVLVDKLGDDYLAGLATAADITTYNRDFGGPVFIPRNMMLQRALQSAEAGHPDDYFALLKAVTDPYNPEAGPAWMAEPEGEQPFVTFCGT